MFESIGVETGKEEKLVKSLPFSLDDVTAGTETELQTVVIGEKNTVDLALSILHSKYFLNLKKRYESAEAPRKAISDIETYLDSNKDGVWENSWVCFPLKLMNQWAVRTFMNDLRADKDDISAGSRKDAHRYLLNKYEGEYVRVPVSYLLKLALCDVVTDAPDVLLKVYERVVTCFISDNTSPETHSFYITNMGLASGLGLGLAHENAKRFLLTNLLAMYANKKFRLDMSGQHVKVFNSPHPPIRQKLLNDCIPDSFYRELFMNPCLAGWSKGEEKHKYMHLCHEVLSKSLLNGMYKLKEAGIVANNLVVLPNTSSICLANNGTHLSIGSKKLTGARNMAEGFEKYTGDLAIKIVEHFLPLFTATYTAAPYRLGFADFHPERLLAPLSHELHYRHLRMFWQQWLKKANIRFLNKPITPFGPPWIDRLIANFLNFKGDYVPDYRLLDYLVSLLSTENSPALDGAEGNGERLKKDLMHTGVFHDKMSLYLLYRLRRRKDIGYCGFEGRHYSLFESITGDLSHAANLQVLITALAYKYMASGEVHYHHIPDTPFVESERRHIIFAAACGIPAFYVKANTDNLFLQRILKNTVSSRASKRYAGYLKVRVNDYQRALLNLIKEDGSGLIELYNMEDTIKDLYNRIVFYKENSVFSKLTTGILNVAGVSSPFKLSAFEYNTALEEYYREPLRLKHIKEGLTALRADFETGICRIEDLSHSSLYVLKQVLGNRQIGELLESCLQGIFKETISERDLISLIYVLLINIYEEIERLAHKVESFNCDEKLSPSVH